SFACRRRQATENAVRWATCITTLPVCDKSETMKPRHAAALALVGWYLMVPPPPLPPNATPDLSTPLSGWKIIGFFNGEGDCERIRSSVIQTGQSATKHTLEQTFVCVATDDPRIKYKVTP